jgi:hypothetical protein
VSPKHLSGEALVVLQDIRHRISVPDLLDRLYLDLFFEFPLWIYTDFEVQRELLQFLIVETRARRDVRNMTRLYPLSLYIAFSGRARGFVSSSLYSAVLPTAGWGAATG